MITVGQIQGSGNEVIAVIPEGGDFPKENTTPKPLDEVTRITLMSQNQENPAFLPSRRGTGFGAAPHEGSRDKSLAGFRAAPYMIVKKVEYYGQTTQT